MKKWMLLAISPVLANAMPVHAQSSAGSAQSTSTGPAESLEEVIVTGIRHANQAAIESKQRAINITDVVSATDVRALPDVTVAEALRRVPGLSVVPASDNEHSRDEATTAV